MLQVTVLALASLTNVALAFMLDPECPKNLQELVILVRGLGRRGAGAGDRGRGGRGVHALSRIPPTRPRVPQEPSNLQELVILVHMPGQACYNTFLLKDGGGPLQ